MEMILEISHELEQLLEHLVRLAKIQAQAKVQSSTANAKS